MAIVGFVLRFESAPFLAGPRGHAVGNRGTTSVPALATHYHAMEPPKSSDNRGPIPSRTEVFHDLFCALVRTAKETGVKADVLSDAFIRAMHRHYLPRRMRRTRR